jgi:hypothetical protein
LCVADEKDVTDRKIEFFVKMKAQQRDPCLEVIYGSGRCMNLTVCTTSTVVLKKPVLGAITLTVTAVADIM